ncbi:hypothetical protein A3B55_05185 [Candidatus Daviesbacteria bacterium RIFCSPLOWO2_01_FULL_43_15]|nr:MAG: hypothetical protein A3B55_05185 [Candidatus Daviesbacteria bacterium RIFCSPLOWO2_01_FULL_43_15]
MVQTLTLLKKEISSSLKEKELLGVFNLSLCLFWGYFSLFYLFFKPIHQFYPEIDPKTLLWWQQQFLFRDGLEPQVMLIGGFLYIGSYLFLSYRLKSFSWLRSKFLLVVLLLITGYLTLKIQTPIIRLASLPQIAALVLGTLVLVSSGYLVSKSLLFKKHPRFVKSFGWLCLVILVIFGLDVASIYDFGYYLGPALKLLQGEKLGSFYIQYGVVGTWIFELMMMLKLKIYQMQVILGVLFVMWLFLYYQASKYLIEEKFLRFIFVVALVIIRYLSINHDPIRLPQVQPFRLDLWLIAFLVTARFGFISWVSASVFALLYIFDNSFGFLYLGVYGLSLVLKYIVSKKERKELLKKAWQLIFPIAIAAIFNLYFFQSLTSPAAKLYEKVQLGLMPIAWNSPFWLIFAGLPICCFWLGKQPLKLLLLGLTLVELVYFYGRAHDHNLLNISGILVLLFFTSLDSFAKSHSKKILPQAVGLVLILISIVIFSGHIFSKLERAKIHVLAGQVFPISDYEVSVLKNTQMFSIYPKQTEILILSQFDTFLNYHWGLKQIGKIVPFSINLYVDKTSDFLKENIDQGVKVVVWETEMIEMLKQLNSSDHMKQQMLQFILIQMSGFWEVKYEKIPRN